MLLQLCNLFLESSMGLAVLTNLRVSLSASFCACLAFGRWPVFWRFSSCATGFGGFAQCVGWLLRPGVDSVFCTFQSLL